MQALRPAVVYDTYGRRHVRSTKKSVWVRSSISSHLSFLTMKPKLLYSIIAPKIPFTFPYHAITSIADALPCNGKTNHVDELVQCTKKLMRERSCCKEQIGRNVPPCITIAYR